jgi:hypothetical protein
MPVLSCDSMFSLILNHLVKSGSFGQDEMFLSSSKVFLILFASPHNIRHVCDNRKCIACTAK